MKPKNKLLPFLILCLVLSLFISPLSTKAADYENEALPTAAEYDLTIGGTQEFTIADAEGNTAYVTISEEPSTSRIANGTYRVTYTSTGCWTARYNVVISNNSISSVNSPAHAAITGTIIYSRLVKESSKQATYYLTRQLNAYTIHTGMRSVISGTTLKVYGI